MQISGRNQLRGKFTALRGERLVVEVEVDIGGQSVVSTITAGSAQRLGLKVGDKVTAIIKASEVTIGKPGRGAGLYDTSPTPSGRWIITVTISASPTVTVWWDSASQPPPSSTRNESASVSTTSSLVERRGRFAPPPRLPRPKGVRPPGPPV